MIHKKYLYLTWQTRQVTFDPVYGMLNGVNVGDSGALLLRRCGLSPVSPGVFSLNAPNFLRSHPCEVKIERCCCVVSVPLRYSLEREASDQLRYSRVREATLFVSCESGCRQVCRRCDCLSSTCTVGTRGVVHQRMMYEAPSTSAGPLVDTALLFLRLPPTRWIYPSVSASRLTAPKGKGDTNLRACLRHMTLRYCCVDIL